jgi:hypothetical protein
MSIARARDRVGRVFTQRCFYLFLVLLGVIVMVPLAGESARAATLLNLFDSLVLLAATAAVGRTTASFVVAVMLAVPTMLLQYFATHYGDPLTMALYLWFLGLFVLATTIYLLQYVLRRDVMTMDKLYGLAAAYLMLGFLWTIAYSIVQFYVPESFSMGGTPVAMLSASDRLYFSLTTLTSTGFGDIAPIKQPAKTLVVLEQIAGTLFVAILIARLSGAYPPPRDETAR